MSETLGRAILELATDDRALDQGIDRAHRGADQLGDKFEETGRSIRQSFKDVGQSMEAFGEHAMKAGAVLSAAFTVPLVGVIKAAGDFEKSMNKVRAVSGATGEDFAALQAQARQLGETTSFSASQAADGMSFLAMAGFKTEQILGAMPGTLSLAAAGQMDLARTADIASNILTGFKIPAEEMGRVADIMAKAMSSANTNIEQLGEGMKFVAPLAAAAGVSIEETTAAIGLLSNAGIQGSMAGTSLRRAFAELINPGKNLQAILDQTGIQTVDASGKMRAFADIIGDFRAAGVDAAGMMEAFGQRAGPAMIELVGQGGDALREFTAVLQDSGGTAADIAGTQIQGFNGSLVILKSALEGLAIAIASAGLLEFATDAVAILTEAVRWFTAMPEPVQKFGAVMLATLGIGGPVLLAIGAMSKGIGILIAATGPIGLFIGAAVLLTAAWVAFGDDIKRVLGGAFDWVHQRFTQAHDWIVGTFTVTKNKVLELWTLMVEGLKTIILGPFTAITDTVKNAWKSITDGAAAMYQKIVGGSIIPDMVIEVGQWFRRMVNDSGALMGTMRKNTEASAKGQLVASSNAFAGMFSAFAGFSSDMFRFSQIAGAAQAFVSTMVGAAEALKLPFPANLAAAAKVLATGFGFISAIKGASIAHAGGGAQVATGAIRARPAETPAAPMQQNQTGTPRQEPRVLNLYIRGMLTEEMVRDELAPALQEAWGDGITINTRTV